MVISPGPLAWFIRARLRKSSAADGSSIRPVTRPASIGQPFSRGNRAPDCDGGELVMESSVGEASYKLPAGSAVTYASTMLHRVAEVTRGTREVAVTWAQSMIRRPDQREILFDLERTSRSVFERDGKSPEFDLLNKSTANLRRMWVEN